MPSDQGEIVESASALSEGQECKIYDRHNCAPPGTDVRIYFARRARRVRSSGVTVLICLTFFRAASAQEPVQHNKPATTTLSVDVDRVNVLFTVADSRGKFIRNLGKDDFRVYEDDRRQNISNFSTETNLPLNIAFLIDSSGSNPFNIGNSSMSY